MMDVFILYCMVSMALAVLPNLPCSLSNRVRLKPCSKCVGTQISMIVMCCSAVACMRCTSYKQLLHRRQIYQCRHY